MTETSLRFPLMSSHDAFIELSVLLCYHHHLLHSFSFCTLSVNNTNAFVFMFFSFPLLSSQCRNGQWTALALSITSSSSLSSTHWLLCHLVIFKCHSPFKYAPSNYSQLLICPTLPFFPFSSRPQFFSFFDLFCPLFGNKLIVIGDDNNLRTKVVCFCITHSLSVPCRNIVVASLYHSPVLSLSSNNSLTLLLYYE